MRPEHNGHAKVPTPTSARMVPSVFVRLCLCARSRAHLICFYTKHCRLRMMDSVLAGIPTATILTHTHTHTHTHTCDTYTYIHVHIHAHAQVSLRRQS